MGSPPLWLHPQFVAVDRSVEFRGEPLKSQLCVQPCAKFRGRLETAGRTLRNWAELAPTRYPHRDRRAQRAKLGAHGLRLQPTRPPSHFGEETRATNSLAPERVAGQKQRWRDSTPQWGERPKQVR